MQRDLWRDTERIVKPIVDEYEAEEFDRRIDYAMEYSLEVKLTLWFDEFTEDIAGRVHYVDPVTHQLRIEVKPGEFNRLAFEDIVGVIVVD